MKIIVNSSPKPNNVDPYFEAFLSISLASMVSIGMGSRENLWIPSFNSSNW